jgi:hypothetical protein
MMRRLLGCLRQATEKESTQAMMSRAPTQTFHEITAGHALRSRLAEKL